MNFTLLKDPDGIRARFREKFVPAWAEFQVHHANWIAEVAARNYVIDADWYAQSYMWERFPPDVPYATMEEALSFLRTRTDSVYLISEAANHHSHPRLSIAGVHHTNFAALCNATELADLIKHEWFEDYRLSMQNMYDPDPVLPSELYIFDPEMTWCAVFTHETTDWESELDDPMKAAQSRYCMILPPESHN